MKESEYTILENKLRVITAIETLSQVLPGEKYGISTQKLEETKDLLREMRNKSGDMLEFTEDDKT